MHVYNDRKHLIDDTVGIVRFPGGNLERSQLLDATVAASIR